MLLDLDQEMQRPVLDVAENQNPWTIFLEMVPPDSGLNVLQPFDKDSDVLLFFKLYDPKNKKIHYCGHHYMPVDAKVRKYPRKKKYWLKNFFRLIHVFDSKL